MKFFFVNGGLDCYIVFVGSYKDLIKIEDFFGEVFDGDEMKLLGIILLKKYLEFIMLVILDVVLLSREDCGIF